jgi:KipI family sensor histidine kinase inhibitor
MAPTISALGDACLSVAFEPSIDPLTNARCVALARAIESGRLSGVRDVVPAYHTVGVYFDPTRIPRGDLEKILASLVRDIPDGAPVTDSLPIEIVVTYGGEYGPDLASLATFARCNEQEVIRLHTATVYRVYMVGFLPGFAYLGTVDARIAMPRLDEPRTRVPAGSVAIAGAQTGIYPRESPGGWRIIGRTSATLFDPSSSQAAMLKVGDRVRFVAA